MPRERKGIDSCGEDLIIFHIDHCVILVPKCTAMHYKTTATSYSLLIKTSFICDYLL